MNNISKKIATILITFVFVLVVIVMPVPRARALFGVGDVVFDPAVFGRAVASIGLNVAHWVKDDLMATLRDMVVKTLVDEMTNKIVDSINNNGSPRYITNWKSYLDQSGEIAFSDLNEYLQKMDGQNLCVPFYSSIQSNLNSSINNPYGELPSPGSSCTFSKFKSDLKNGDHFIEKGGWSAYNKLFIPSNNYWMSKELVEDKYQRDLVATEEARKSEAVANNGFLSIKKCISREPGWTSNTGEKIAGKCTSWRVVTPGKAIADAMDTAINSNAWYMTNVKSIISAVTNSLISKILGTGGLPNSGSGTVGATYSVGSGSALGKQVAKSNQDSLNYIRNGYNGIKNYSENVKSKINESSAQINNLASCSSGLVSNHISSSVSGNRYGYNNGSISCIATSALGGSLISYNVLSSDHYTTVRKTSSINSLETGFISESAHLGNAIAGSIIGLNEINGIDLNGVNAQLEISKAYTSYNNFIAQYPDINNDVTYVNAGLQGKLLVKYGSIYSAVSAYSCASKEECYPSNAVGR